MMRSMDKRLKGESLRNDRTTRLEGENPRLGETQGIMADMDAIGSKRKRSEEESPVKQQTELNCIWDAELKSDFADLVWYAMILQRNLNVDKYKEFLQIMNGVRQRRISRVVAVKKVKELLREHPRLLLGFSDFLTKGLDETDLSITMKGPDYEDCSSFFLKIKSRFSRKDKKWKSFKKIMSLYINKKWSIDGVIQEVIMLFQGHDDLVEQFISFIPSWFEKVAAKDWPLSEYAGLYGIRDIESPSYYCLLHSIPRSSQAASLEESVINHRLICVAPGNASETFELRRKSIYEECLLRCEDDRYELDMLLRKLASTAKKVDSLLEKFPTDKIGPGTASVVESHFTAEDLRCIQQLYSDFGSEVICLLRTNGSIILPIIRNRLQQKLEEGSRKRVDLEKVWAKVVGEYHLK
ncbi:paired amphipathic helix protein Sin3-like 4 isoform X2 [Zingiber officinale]|uniref:paired amphipathic helix protein Sin3-like 4 isoform X2 n=1 Tax=Zingiber officinale TaxID=94328 RepID=UPI001C4BC092|nr:paired amphipathic helix protein Sin3-like 4 isoform X2 [Zingiber officinale]